MRTTYLDWIIEYRPLSYLPEEFHWTYTHKNYDGQGPDYCDGRHGRASSAAACRDAVDEYESEHETQARRDELDALQEAAGDAAREDRS